MVVVYIFSITKVLSFHNRKLEDFILRKKQHKEPKWTGTLCISL